MGQVGHLEVAIRAVETEWGDRANDQFLIRRRDFAIELEAALDLRGLAGIDDDIGAICETFESFARGRMVNFETHALLAEIVAGEAEAVFGIAPRRRERAKAARIGASPPLELDHFGSERRQQQSGELPAFVAAFEHDGAVKRRAHNRFGTQITQSSLSAAISSG